MGKKRKELSHEEIWDDAGLVDSWNTSYEEYKLYHSIHARGENLEDALAAADRDAEGAGDAKHEGDTAMRNAGGDAGAEADEGLDNKQRGGDPGDDAGAHSADGVGTAMRASGRTAPTRAGQAAPADGGKQPAADAGAGAGGPSSSADPASQAVPAAANGMMEQLAAQSSHNEPLKNLMMSWYWAGYYTGLHEGQQQQ